MTGSDISCRFEQTWRRFFESLGGAGQLGGIGGWLTATRTFYWGWGQKAYIDSVSSGPQLNQSVCKLGSGCGTIFKLNHSFYDGDIGEIVGGQVLTSILNGSTRCTFGDSGGPFFRATSAGMQAYGVLKGALVDDDNYLRCAFTPVNRFYNGARYHVWSR